MKKILALALSLVMAAMMFTACGGDGATPKTRLEQIQEAGVLRVAISPDFAPSEFKDPVTGEVLGSDVFVAQYIADYLGVELEIVELDFKACQVAVSSGTVDISLSSFAATAERQENFICTVPYGFSTSEDFQGLLVPLDMVEVYNTAESFAGKTIAVQNASLQLNLAMAQLPEDVTFEYVTTVTTGALMLSTGKVDALVTTNSTGSLLAGNYEGFAMAAFHLEYNSEGTVGLIQLGQDDLATAVNEALAQMNAEVDWSEIRAQYTDMAAALGVTNE
ncbi:transporter substrate-binding domain-containing protein [Ruminococcaceae bacterium OttesenSCG-928-N02]|nr:transporter substrate-binding domain-containing protein [Ruminococcaceae bacterium OttesenSCG-928-N02]